MMSVGLKRLDNAAEEFCHGKVDDLNDQKTQTASAFSVLDEDDPSPKGRLDIFSFTVSVENLLLSSQIIRSPLFEGNYLSKVTQG